MNQEQIEKLHSLAQEGIQKTKLAQQFGISRETLYKYLSKNSYISVLNNKDYRSDNTNAIIS